VVVTRRGGIVRGRKFIQIETLESRLLLAATPYTSDGLPWAIASDRVSWVEAENFDNGGEGVAYHDTNTANQGGAYRTSEGVDLEGPNASCDNTYNIGYTNNGEWTQYTINVAVAGTYRLNLRASAAGTGGTASVTFNAGSGVYSTTSLTVPGTGGWQTYVNVQTDGGTTVADVTLQAGVQTMRLNVVAAGFNSDFISLTPVAVLSNPEQPYGTVRGLPPLINTWGSATVEAENYDLGGQDVAYHKGNIAQNTHGSYTTGTPPVTYTFRATDYVSTAYLPYSNSDLTVVKWDAGDWTQYSIVTQTAGTYEILGRTRFC
jgi:hypothetical protein